MLLAVYSDVSGKPSTLLGVSAVTPVNGTQGWQTVSLNSPVSVNSGETVWLAWVFETNPGIRFITGTPGRASSGIGYSGGMPATFGTSSVSNYKYSIYCTYFPNVTKSAEIETPDFTISETPEMKSIDFKVYPNPFNKKLIFEFESPIDDYAILEIYDIHGKSIARLMDQPISGGVLNHVDYVPAEIIPGIYIYRLTLDNNITTGKIVYNKK